MEHRSIMKDTKQGHKAGTQSRDTKQGHKAGTQSGKKWDNKKKQQESTRNGSKNYKLGSHITVRSAK